VGNEVENMKVLKVLIACEFSGIVRDAFAAKGHDAWSCDLLPTERAGKHIQMDVLKILDDGWDMMIAHPPCTHLAVSGARWFKEKQKDGRQQQGIDFFLKLVNAPIEKIAVENPICIMNKKYKKPDQIIQPYQFGHDASKSTCLWLNGLPRLKPTQYIEPRLVDGKKRWGNQTDGGQNKLCPSEHRAADRSRTYQGIANAMAEQWGNP
jgi:hypothetical protein